VFGSTISAVPPEKYSKRFVDFIEKLIVTDTING